MTRSRVATFRKAAQNEELLATGSVRTHLQDQVPMSVPNDQAINLFNYGTNILVIHILLTNADGRISFGKSAIRMVR